MNVLDELLNFTPLSVIRSIKEDKKKYNICVVVTSYTLTKINSPNASNPLSASFTIVDDSLTSPAEAVQLIMFGDKEKSFPLAFAVGNVLSICDVKSQIYQNAVQLVGYSMSNRNVCFYERLDFRSCLPTLGGLPMVTLAARNEEEFKIISHSKLMLNADTRYYMEISNRAVESKRPFYDSVFDKLLPKINELTDWSKNFLFEHSLADQVVPQLPLDTIERNQLLLNAIQAGTMPTSVRSHVLTHPAYPGEILTRCDMACMFGGIFDIYDRTMSSSSSSSASSSASPSSSCGRFVLVWDGSTSGEFGLPDSTYLQWAHPIMAAALNEHQELFDSKLPDAEVVSSSCLFGLQAANLFAERVVRGVVTDCLHDSREELLDLLDGKLLTPSQPTGVARIPLNCRPCLLHVKSDKLITVLQGIIPGSWIRIRKMHMNIADSPTTAFTVPVMTTENGASESSQRLNVVGTMADDSNVIVLLPICRDVQNIVHSYCARDFGRTTSPLVFVASTMTTATSANENTSVIPTIHTSTTAEVAHPANETASRPSATSPEGVHYSRLAFCLAVPMPSKHVVRVKIIGYWPRDVSSFAVDDGRGSISAGYLFANGAPGGDVLSLPTEAKIANSKRLGEGLPTSRQQRRKRRANVASVYQTQPDSFDESDEDIGVLSAESSANNQALSGSASNSVRKVLMFSVRVTDGDAVADVICFDKDAEMFLGGISVGALIKDKAVAKRVEMILTRAVQSDRLIDMFIRCYSATPSLGVADLPKRRLAVFNTNLLS